MFSIERSDSQTIEQDSTEEKRTRTSNSQETPDSPHLVKQQKRRREPEVARPPSRPAPSRDGQSTRAQSPERPRKLLRLPYRPRTEQAEKREAQETQAGPSRISPKLSLKLLEATVDEPDGVLQEARVIWWSEKRTWPTKEDELLDCFRSFVEYVRAKRRSLNRKRSNGSMTSGSSLNGSLLRGQKCVPYRHQLFEQQLKVCGSFLDDHELGISPESESLCEQLLKGQQPTPEKTLFSDDDLFKKTCRRLKGENETKVALRISELIVPSAEVLADQGAKHLSIVREGTSANCMRSVPFIPPPATGTSSRSSGRRPQPDAAKGFDRDAFNNEQLRKLHSHLGDLFTDSFFFSPTFQLYFSFLTSEVKCGDGGLDSADRQNAYSQTVLLLGLYMAFRLAGREQELHREINGFSVSHDERHVRIYGHYFFIKGIDVEIYRHLISEFIFAPSGEGDQRWEAYKFVKNVYDLWLPKHFERLCSVIDMLPEVSDAEQELGSLRSGLSQQFED